MSQHNSVFFIVAELGAWALGRRRRVVVGGRSMVPTLEPGWFVLYNPNGEVCSGEVAVAQTEGLTVVKRAIRGDEDRWSLRSDNRTQGSDFDGVDRDSLLGPVTLVLDSPRRRVSV